jgi:hypothetical protein
MLGVLGCLLMGVSSVCLAQGQSNHETASTPAGPAAQATERVPVMDGGAGPCSVELTVTRADGKPVYAARIKVHIAYGFGGMRRLDLEAGTNSDGKVKFSGLPARVRRPPLEFHAAKDELVGVAIYDPSTECDAKHGIALSTGKAQDGHSADR